MPVVAGVMRLGGGLGSVPGKWPQGGWWWLCLEGGYVCAEAPLLSWDPGTGAAPVSTQCVSRVEADSLVPCPRALTDPGCTQEPGWRMDQLRRGRLRNDPSPGCCSVGRTAHGEGAKGAKFFLWGNGPGGEGAGLGRNWKTVFKRECFLGQEAMG